MLEHLATTSGVAWGGCATVKSYSLPGGCGSLAAGLGVSQPSFTSCLHCFLDEDSM